MFGMTDSEIHAGRCATGPNARPRKITRAAVVGTGSMGAGIAHALMLGGIRVVAIDEDGGSLDRAAARIEKSLQRRVARGGLSDARRRDMLALLSTTTRWQNLRGVDVAIEAVFEDPAVKRSVIDRLERTCGESTVIATNTSTISLDVLSAEMRHPGRLIGMHFFNPAHHMPLVEVIAHERVLPEVTAAALGLVRGLGKSPVLVENREGFLVNRVFIPYLKEAFWLLEEGAAPLAVDLAMVEFGFPMGPLALVDMGGLDILVATDRALRGAFSRHGPMPPLAAELAARGRYGQKTGSGVYKYVPGDHTPRNSETTARLMAERSAGGDRPNDCGDGEMPSERIAHRLVMRMIAEASHVLNDGIVRDGRDLDAAMVLGVGFPDFRGGPVQYARQLGLDRVAAELRELAARHGARFSPHPTLTTTMKGTQ